MPRRPPPPPRLLAREERVARRVFSALSPRVARIRPPQPLAGLAPYVDLAIEREHGEGPLAATWFPTEGAARGAVLLLHPWLTLGKSYFYRRGRIQALRAAGYHALAVDFSGFGESGSPPPGFLHHDVEASLAFLRRRVGNLPLHVWGVSSGGYWAHPVLSSTDLVSGAMFEDVALHLTDWGWRTAPALRPGYLAFRYLFSRAYRFLDVRRHAARLRVQAASYVSGERDANVLPEETRQLAALAGGSCRIVAGADHLDSIRIANAEILALALETFRLAEERSGGGRAAARAEGSPASLPRSSLSPSLLVVLGLLLSSGSAFAWGPNGHRVVGRIAEHHLSAAAARAVAAILGPESLAQASTWADEIRSDPAWDRAKPWHYVDIEDGETYATAAKAPGGDVIEAIGRFTRTLRDPRATAAQKVEVLRFLVHLVGDIHQPLHVGRHADQGGNTVQVTWYGAGANLHQVWDEKILAEERLSYSEIVEFIDHPTDAEVKSWQASGVLDWAQESIDARPRVYAVGDGKLGYAYADRNDPLVRRRLLQAGVRLAGLLNSIFASPAP